MSVTQGQDVKASRYLRVEDLRGLRHVTFSARRPVEGYYIGRHRSPQRGYSVEFSDYREYTPGDDVNAVDWKVYGRSDRLYLKLFEHESDLTVTLLIDASASMAYAGLDAPTAADRGRAAAGSWLDRVSLVRKKRRDGPRVLSKYDQACHLAAAIAFLMTKQGDRVGFAAARDGLSEALEPRGSTLHLHAVLRAMERITPGGEAKLVDALDLLAQRTRRRSVLIVFSDLLEDREAILKKLAVFRARGGEVIVFHVLHPDEMKLPDLDEAVFVDSESGARLAMSVPDLRERYDATVRGFLDGWATACARSGVDYNRVTTDVPYHKPLGRYLLTRAGAR